MDAEKTWIRKPPGQFGFLIMIFSMASHALAFNYLVDHGNGSTSYLMQLRVLIIASFLFATLPFVFRSTKTFFYAYISRTSLVILAVAIINSKDLFLELLFVIPLVVESAIRLHWLMGAISSISIISILALVDLSASMSDGFMKAVYHLAFILIIPGTIAFLSSYISSYRDLLDDRDSRLKSLRLAVEDLGNANRAFQDYADTIENRSAEHERNRITRELHDLIGYALTNIIMLMNASKLLLDKPKQLNELLNHAKQQADSALQESRRVLYHLRAIKSGGPGGLHALFQLVEVFSRATNIKVDVNYGNLPMSYDEQIDNVIYRILQEGLTNSLKHGKAQKITIILWQTDKEIMVLVRDDGGGAVEVSEGLGLRGMRERLSELGGSVDAHNVGYGFELIANIPVQLKDAVRT